MSILNLLKNVVIGAPLGVVAVTVLPIFGAVGSITATGVAVGAVIGAVGGVVDSVTSKE